MPYYEYVFVVLIFIGIAALCAHAYGMQTIAGSLLIGLVGLLLVALRRERSW